MQCRRSTTPRPKPSSRASWASATSAPSLRRSPRGQSLPPPSARSTGASSTTDATSQSRRAARTPTSATRTRARTRTQICLLRSQAWAAASAPITSPRVRSLDQDVLLRRCQNGLDRNPNGTVLGSLPCSAVLSVKHGGVCTVR
eukprot:6202175-Pleurochrysis_carterae.AAC.1